MEQQQLLLLLPTGTDILSGLGKMCWRSNTRRQWTKALINCFLSGDYVQNVLSPVSFGQVSTSLLMPIGILGNLSREVNSRRTAMNGPSLEIPSEYK
ncbi:hypothetical protein UY3_05518 [Chelonia mydas]|uniref:Uncharacterized protein n=1 Tax=Chelonia mydas TaxID=8469 RepID=M7BHA6_CHEMY|nr:hypothetical protein UY3_05518 [Chelonia mydas]